MRPVVNANVHTLAHPNLFPDVHFALWLARVSFRYPGQVRYALQDVSVEAPPGSVVALSGGSGAGKSTLLRLCARELESGASQLTLDSAPLGSIDNDTFWQRIGYVAQNSHVFSGTLRDNLLLACPDASEADLWAVPDVVGLADLVRRLPDALDTPVGEEGDNLSDGERRRLCVARAILRRPALLLLDEPTARR